MPENGSDLPINEHQKIRRYRTRSIKEIMWYLCKCAIIAMLYTHFSGIIAERISARLIIRDLFS